MKGKWLYYTIAIFLIAAVPIGLLLYIYSLLLNGFLFYLLLGPFLIILLFIYMLLRIFLAYAIVRLYGYPEEGEYKYPSKKLDPFFACVILNSMVNHFKVVFNHPLFFEWFYRNLFKAKIEKLRMLGHCMIADPHLTEIGEGSIIAQDAGITAHLIEKGKIILKRVKIGKNCTIGARSAIGPGVVIGDNTIVGALSGVPKYAKLDGNSVYVGIPVRKLKANK